MDGWMDGSYGYGVFWSSVSLDGLHYNLNDNNPIEGHWQHNFLTLIGGKVNKASFNRDEDTPLHIAARFGVPELVALYLAHGAAVNAVNARLETPLFTAVYWAFDTMKEQPYSQDHHLVCRILLDHKAGERASGTMSGVHISREAARNAGLFDNLTQILK